MISQFLVKIVFFICIWCNYGFEIKWISHTWSSKCTLKAKPKRVNDNTWKSFDCHSIKFVVHFYLMPPIDFCRISRRNPKCLFTFRIDILDLRSCRMAYCTSKENWTVITVIPRVVVRTSWSEQKKYGNNDYTNHKNRVSVWVQNTWRTMYAWRLCHCICNSFHFSTFYFACVCSVFTSTRKKRCFFLDLS